MEKGRNNKGQFAKGHPDFVKAAGVKAGRPRELKRLVNDALDLAEDAMPDIISMMISRAQDPLNRDCQRAAEYLCDRIYGRANQPLSNAGKTPFESFVFLLPDGTKIEPKRLVNGSSHEA